MSTQKLYDQWSATYDAVENKTRDLEKLACEHVLSDVEFETVMELGGGTGKNTAWLARRSKRVVSIELSEQMQAIARSKVQNPNVEFRLGDIREPWPSVAGVVDLITCSLILEHIEHLAPIFGRAFNTLKPNGYFYICELHPFKQYRGSKARFEAGGETKVLDCYRHNFTDYTDAALAAGYSISKVDEWFDEGDRSQIPRLVSFLFTNKR